MGLIYSSKDASTLKSSLSANLSIARTTIRQCCHNLFLCPFNQIDPASNIRSDYSIFDRNQDLSRMFLLMHG